MKPQQKSKLYFTLAIAATLCIAFLVIMGLRKPASVTPPSLGASASTSFSQGEASGNKPALEAALATAKAESPNAAAWIAIPSTDINNVVMQTTNNEYYLSRDEQGKQDVWGSYFADYYANLTQPSNLIQNTVIYGHTGNTEDPNGQRFSQLFRFAELDFLRKNPNIYFAVGNETLTFEIFAVFYSDTDFYYIDPAPTDQGFDVFINEVNARNEFVFEGREVTAQDKLLTLSGCSHKYDVNATGNQRFVVMARLVEDGAASAELSLQPNPSPKRPNP